MIHRVLHSTTRAILDGLVKDVIDTKMQMKTSMLVSKLEEMNQSFAIKKFPFSKEDKRRETLTDLDCIAIREAK